MTEIEKLNEALADFDRYRPKDGLARVFIQKDGSNYEMINGKINWDKPFSQKEIEMVDRLSGGNSPIFIMGASEFFKTKNLQK